MGQTFPLVCHKEILVPLFCVGNAALSTAASRANLIFRHHSPPANQSRRRFQARPQRPPNRRRLQIIRALSSHRRASTRRTMTPLNPASIPSLTRTLRANHSRTAALGRRLLEEEAKSCCIWLHFFRRPKREAAIVPSAPSHRITVPGSGTAPLRRWPRTETFRPRIDCGRDRDC